MKFSALQGVRLITIFSLILTLLFCISCVSNNIANQANTNKESNTAQIAEKAPTAASDDAEELAKLIKLPLSPEDVRWMPDVAGKNQSTNALATNAAGTASGKRLVAVLKYSDADSESLTSQVQKIEPATPAAFIPLEWFPEELIAQSEIAGDQSLKGKQYDARDFLQAPYVKGRLIKLEQSGYFILELTTY